MQGLVPGDRIWVDLPGKGYADVARVLQEARPAKDSTSMLDSKETPFYELPLAASFSKDSPDEKAE